jgi:hypothetical protein
MDRSESHDVGKLFLRERQLVIAFFAGAFALGEWLARRTDRSSGNGGDPSPG